MILNDRNPYLIALLRAVQDGWQPPDEITEEQYYFIRDRKDDMQALAGFAGFACSFGGKFFGGFARDKRGTRNFARAGKVSLLRDMQPLMQAQILCGDYRDVPITDDAVIYADPPYAGTTGYNHERFDTEAFWQYAREMSKDHRMFISEMNAPEDFIPVWQKQVRRDMSCNAEQRCVVTEKLYIHESRAAEF